MNNGKLEKARKRSKLLKKKKLHPAGSETTAIPQFEIKTRRFRKRNWAAFMIVNISELEKGNGELYMVRGNLDFSMAYLSSVKF